MKTDTLIIGAGLSGLSLAAKLAAEGRAFLLLEARNRVGGRVLTEEIDGGAFDLGPAWFWPGQPRIATLINELGLSAFEQYSDGILSFEDENQRVERGRGFASMQGSLRLEGGLGRLTGSLAKRIPAENIKLSTKVLRLTHQAGRVTAHCTSDLKIEASQVVLAMPPRLVDQLTFEPALPETAHASMRSVATWMAGQAKAIAVYDQAFWRDAGLSGDAMSRHGPLVEIHDASPNSESGPFALFGFIGIPPQARQNVSELKDAIRAQLGRLFGADAATPSHLILKDWAQDPHTAVPDDQKPLYAHPTYGLTHTLQNLWNGRLILSGTETAPQFGGYLEGALEAAEIALSRLEAEKV